MRILALLGILFFSFGGRAACKNKSCSNVHSCAGFLTSTAALQFAERVQSQLGQVSEDVHLQSSKTPEPFRWREVNLAGLIVNLEPTFVPAIRVTFPKATVPEILGHSEVRSIEAGAKSPSALAAIFNPERRRLSHSVITRVIAVMQGIKTNSNRASSPAGELYERYIEALDNKTDTRRVSVLSPPVDRKNFQGEKSDRADIVYPEGWVKPGLWNQNYVLYVTDGKSHYSFDIMYSTVRTHDQSLGPGSDGVKVEVMVASTLSRLQRMLSARFGQDLYSSQGTFQTDPALLNFQFLNDQQWNLLLNSPN